MGSNRDPTADRKTRCHREHLHRANQPSVPSKDLVCTPESHAIDAIGIDPSAAQLSVQTVSCTADLSHE
jgi:hypothetical protein